MGLTDPIHPNPGPPHYLCQYKQKVLFIHSGFGFVLFSFALGSSWVYSRNLIGTLIKYVLFLQPKNPMYFITLDTLPNKNNCIGGGQRFLVFCLFLKRSLLSV